MSWIKSYAALPFCAAVAVFAPIASASAAYAPQLVVTPSAPTLGARGATVSLKATAADDPTARSVVYVPLGYAVGHPAVDAPIGSATATLTTAAGQERTVSGTIVGAAAADYAANTCVQKPDSVWVVKLAVGSTVVQIPLLVAAAPQSAVLFAATTLTACWPAPNAVAGLRFSSLTFELAAGALRGPTVAGTYRWRAQSTPWAAAGAAPATPPAENPGGAVEAQSLVEVPVVHSLSAKLIVRSTPIDVKVSRVVNGKRLTVTEQRRLITRFAQLQGIATQADEPLVGVTADVLGGTAPTTARRLTTVTTDANGTFHTLIQISTMAKKVYFRTRIALDTRDLGATACVQSFGPAVPCVSATAGPLTVDSKLVRLDVVR